MEKREKVSKILIIIFLLFFSFSFLQFLSPALLHTASIRDLSGLTVIVDNEELIETLPFPHSFIYAVGDRLCHQKNERSFFINENQMPFCSRCIAIWVGVSIGLAFMIFYRVALDERFLFLVIFSLVPVGIDGFGQLLGFWESTNFIRLLTGLFVGIMCGIAIGVIIDETAPLLKKRKVHNK
jgi:uncharacterized membrane protein